MAHFGDVKGKSLVDVGCGRAATSLFFAQRGANVTSVDFSEQAVENLKNFCTENDLGNIRPVHMRAQEINRLEKTDFIFGSMIWHHIEPFGEVATNLRAALQVKVKVFSWENRVQNESVVSDSVKRFRPQFSAVV